MSSNKNKYTRRPSRTPIGEALKPLAMLFQLGIHIITPIIMCLFFGMFLDKTFTGTHFWTLIMIILGVLSGFRNLIIQVLRMSAPKKTEEKNDEVKK